MKFSKQELEKLKSLGYTPSSSDELVKDSIVVKIYKWKGYVKYKVEDLKSKVKIVTEDFKTLLPYAEKLLDPWTYYKQTIRTYLERLDTFDKEVHPILENSGFKRHTSFPVGELEFWGGDNRLSFIYSKKGQIIIFYYDYLSESIKIGKGKDLGEILEVIGEKELVIYEKEKLNALIKVNKWNKEKPLPIDTFPKEFHLDILKLANSLCLTII